MQNYNIVPKVHYWWICRNLQISFYYCLLQLIFCHKHDYVSEKKSCQLIIYWFYLDLMMCKSAASPQIEQTVHQRVWSVLHDICLYWPMSREYCNLLASLPPRLISVLVQGWRHLWSAFWSMSGRCRWSKSKITYGTYILYIPEG